MRSKSFLLTSFLTRNESNYGIFKKHIPLHREEGSRTVLQVLLSELFAKVDLLVEEEPGCTTVVLLEAKEKEGTTVVLGTLRAKLANCYDSSILLSGV